ncbi:MAG: hypothetical protein ACRCSX_10415 [Allorhizobium sp.]
MEVTKEDGVDRECADYVAGYEEGYDLCKSVRRTLNEQVTDTRAALTTATAEAAEAWEQVGFWKERVRQLEQAKADFDAEHLPKYQAALTDNAAMKATIHQQAANAATAAREYVDRVAVLEAELARRDANENRNCINWGPCSRHDGRMSDADPDAETGCADDRSPLGNAIAALTQGTQP